MSLLLDALKKSGDNQQQSSGLSNLTLEEASSSRTASSSTTASSRVAGGTMFAAKNRKPAGFQWKLGLVPTTLLFALIFGSAYGYYVWLEIQPPAQQMAQRSIPLPPSSVAPFRVAPTLVPFIPPQEKSTPVQRVQPMVTARNEDFDAPRVKSNSSRHPGNPGTSGVDIHRKLETDNVTPALLSAYQSYRQGDYVTAAQGYRQVLGNDAHNRDALLGLAAIAQQQGQDEAAQHYYRQLLLLDPRDPVALTALMAYSPDEGNTESRLKSLLDEQPRSSALHFALGNYYAGISNWGEAQQSYFSAHTLEPTNAQFAFNLAVSMDHLGQRKLAAQYYQQALHLDTVGNSGFDHAQAQQRLNELTPAQ
jgi:Flp pilus assembly protein TadD